MYLLIQTLSIVLIRVKSAGELLRFFVIVTLGSPTTPSTPARTKSQPNSPQMQTTNGVNTPASSPSLSLNSPGEKHDDEEVSPSMDDGFEELFVEEDEEQVLLDNMQDFLSQITLEIQFKEPLTNSTENVIHVPTSTPLDLGLERGVPKKPTLVKLTPSQFVFVVETPIGTLTVILMVVMAVMIVRMVMMVVTVVMRVSHFTVEGSVREVLAVMMLMRLLLVMEVVLMLRIVTMVVMIVVSVDDENSGDVCVPW